MGFGFWKEKEERSEGTNDQHLSALCSCLSTNGEILPAMWLLKLIMWPFTKKKPNRLSCIAKSILEDLSKYPASEWDISESRGALRRRWYETFSHPKVAYSLHTCLMDSDERYVSILGVDEGVFGYFDQHQIWCKLRSIQSEQHERRVQAKRLSDEQKLKQLFPKCYEP